MESGKTKRRRALEVAPAKAICAAALLVALAGSLAAAEATPPAAANGWQELIRSIKQLEKVLGFRRTKSFAHYSHKTAVSFRCYYTGKLELPASYEGLHLKAGTQEGCRIDPRRYEVFFYPVEAAPNGKSPVTASLAHESMERFLVVVPHEDFHANREFRQLPATLTEAASTLAGFLTASEVARQKWGADSEVYRNLAREPELFLRKAEIVNRYHAQLSKLYAAERSGELALPEVLARKDKLFQEMQQACKGISPDPRSFNKCLAANNNAGLAFDMTYTKYYPLMYDLFMAYRPNLKATIDALKQALSTRSESEVLQRLRNLAPHFVSSITYSGPPHPVPQRGTTLGPSVDGQRGQEVRGSAEPQFEYVTVITKCCT